MDERKKLIKNENDDMTSDKKDLDDEECEYSYKKTWKGYKHCLNFAVFLTISSLRCIKNTVGCCFGACFYPMKEKVCRCCDDVDKDLNPYKDPNYNPYDYL